MQIFFKNKAKNIYMKIKNKGCEWLLQSVCALFVGFINGFLGGGGGMLCVPTLKKVYKLETKKAHATTIAIMLPISVVSSIIYMFNNYLNFKLSICVILGVLLGGFIGAITLKKINGSYVRWLFIGILFIAGVRMMV